MVVFMLGPAESWTAAVTGQKACGPVLIDPSGNPTGLSLEILILSGIGGFHDRIKQSR